MNISIRGCMIAAILALLGGLAAPAVAQPGKSSGVSAALRVHCREARPGGPEDLVRKLYGRELGAPPVQRRDQLRVVRLSRYFDEKLTTWILRQHMLDCYYGDAGNECDVSDFIVAGDNENIKDFHVCAMKASNKTVSVHFEYKQQPIEFTYTLVHAENGWRISAISHIGIIFDGT